MTVYCAACAVFQALELDPNHVKSLFRRAKCYVCRGEFDWAVRDLVRALELEPENQEVLKSILLGCSSVRGDEDGDDGRAWVRDGHLVFRRRGRIGGARPGACVGDGGSAFEWQLHFSRMCPHSAYVRFFCVQLRQYFAQLVAKLQQLREQRHAQEQQKQQQHAKAPAEPCEKTTGTVCAKKKTYGIRRQGEG